MGCGAYLPSDGKTARAAGECKGIEPGMNRVQAGQAVAGHVTAITIDSIQSRNLLNSKLLTVNSQHHISKDRRRSLGRSRAKSVLRVAVERGAHALAIWRSIRYDVGGGV